MKKSLIDKRTKAVKSVKFYAEITSLICQVKRDIDWIGDVEMGADDEMFGYTHERILEREALQDLIEKLQTIDY